MRLEREKVYNTSLFGRMQIIPRISFLLLSQMIVLLYHKFIKLRVDDDDQRNHSFVVTTNIFPRYY